MSAVWNATVARAPEALALIDGGTGRRWTRAELAREAGQWCAEVAANADLAGRRVVLVEPNGIGWWRAFLGLLEAGAVPAALDGSEPPERQAAIAQEIGAAFICRSGQLERMALSRSPRRRRECLVKLTSGSTGGPKAIAFTHGQMLADGRQVCDSMKIGADDLNLAVIPLGHSYGLGNLVVPLIAQGTAMVCAASPLPQALSADCARWQPTVFPAVPALLAALSRAEIAPRMLASLRLVISAGAPLPAPVAQAFAEKYGRKIHGFYGASETGGICFDRTGEATLAGRSVGQPLEGVALQFRRSGRFVVRSPAVTGKGTYAPPDRGELNSEGEVVLLGRVGRTVKIAARRVDLGEIERALRSVAGVREAFAIAHPEKSDALAAVVGTDLTGPAVRAKLQGLLSPWKIPERLLTVREFPLTARGKQDTRALRSLLSAGSAAAHGSTPKSK